MDIRDLSEFQGDTTEVTERGNTPVLEANSWRVNEEGNVELVAVISNPEGISPTVTCARTTPTISASQ